MVEAADWPEEGVGRTCDLAVERPDTGSAFDDGQSPRAGFFLGPHPESPFVVGVSALNGDIGVRTVEAELGVEEDVELEEFVRCAALRGISIRVTSSLMASSPSPPLVVLQRNGCCKLGGDATVVMDVEFR